MHRCTFLLTTIFVCSNIAFPAEPVAKSPTARGDKMLAEYFEYETAKLEKACLADINTLEDWNAKKAGLRNELLDMLGLNPLPEKSDLKATITGTVEHDEFVVEKIHYQSRPGLYVTGNLYRPKVVTKPLPTVLYVCGHGASKKGNVSFGNKVSYQHHGAWFARNGYVCLVIDSLQLGEIEGIHHGTHRYGMWWWANVGYTPAGVEAWNCVRALDYLETRPEVDKTKFGVTGRSGGGAYSWWIAAIDERIQCAVPVAGITDLRNHVVDGCVEGHCDCMYQQNTYRWDYGTVAALVSPRVLMISNTDHDTIFPLDGVYRTYLHARRIYGLQNAADKLGFNITPGGHKDTQELQVAAFRWLNHHLQGNDAPIEKVAVKYFEPEQLRVFTDLPKDEINTKIHESFTTLAKEPALPKDEAEWKTMRDSWMKQLREQTFRAWPEKEEPLDVKLIAEEKKDGLQMKVYEFTSEGPVRLRMYVTHPADQPLLNETFFHVMDETNWQFFLSKYRPGFEKLISEETLPEANLEEYERMKIDPEDTRRQPLHVYIVPRGVGPTAFDANEKKQVQIRRRFQLLGHTLEERQTCDIVRAISAMCEIDEGRYINYHLTGHGKASGTTLHAALFVTGIKSLSLSRLPNSYRDGPSLLNASRVLDLPQVLAMAVSNHEVRLGTVDKSRWNYALTLNEKFEWKRLHIEKLEEPKKITPTP